MKVSELIELLKELDPDFTIMAMEEPDREQYQITECLKDYRTGILILKKE